MGLESSFWEIVEELASRESLKLQLELLQEQYERAIQELVQHRQAQSGLTEIDVWLDLKDEELVSKGMIVNRFYPQNPGQYHFDLQQRRLARKPKLHQ